MNGLARVVGLLAERHDVCVALRVAFVGHLSPHVEDSAYVARLHNCVRGALGVVEEVAVQLLLALLDGPQRQLCLPVLFVVGLDGLAAKLLDFIQQRFPAPVFAVQELLERL